MILVACIDANKGTMFNNRRQSRDRALIEHILELGENKKIWISNFSKDLFEGCENVLVDDDFINKIEDNDICFVENIALSSMLNKANTIILYNWNREYPSDKYLDITLDDWALETERDFVGYSHERITEQIYVRRKM